MGLCAWHMFGFLLTAAVIGTLSEDVRLVPDSLAGQHPLVSEALVTISGSFRNTATLLEVLVATKIAPISGLDSATA